MIDILIVEDNKELSDLDINFFNDNMIVAKAFGNPEYLVFVKDEFDGGKWKIDCFD